ncbi:MAG TPA: mechanosensitive ion channel family protein [Pyrinomonadaceae bacterium]|jgi:small-conductance mechanosensitive channel
MNFDISPAWAKIQGIVNGFISMLPNLVLALIVFTISCLIARWAKSLIVGFYRRRGRHENLGLVMGRVVQAGIILLNLMIALSIVLPSFHARDLIQVLGISGVAIGFAFRDILQNFLAGILILLAEPFRVGEEIQVGGYNGVVQEIQARATLLKTSDGFLVVIPNSSIYTEKLTVLNSYDTRRTSLEFAISFHDDLEEARRLIVEAALEVEGVLREPQPSAVCVGIGADSITVRARWWTDSKRADEVAARDRVISAIRKRFLEHGIKIASPTQQVLFHDQTEEAEGERRRAGWPPGRKGEAPRTRRFSDTPSRPVETSTRDDSNGHDTRSTTQAERRES